MVRNEKLNVDPKIPANQQRAVGVFKNRHSLEDLLRSLKDSNFDMGKVSLIARNIDDVEGAQEVTEQHGNEAKEGAAAGATTGTVLGGLGGFLVGVGLLAVPGVGPILAAGAEISALASTLAGAGIGAAAGGIIGALVGLGIPEEKAKVYNARVKAGDYLVMITGSKDEINRVESMMRHHHVEDFDIFDARHRDSYDQGSTLETGEASIKQSKEIRTDNNPDVIIIKPGH
jgi:uncharacterized protein YcfJ